MFIGVLLLMLLYVYECTYDLNRNVVHILVVLSSRKNRRKECRPHPRPLVPEELSKKIFSMLNE